MPTYRVTVRHGATGVRYHTLEVAAEEICEAMTRAADEIPAGVRSSADLVEVRLAPDPERRQYTEP